MQLKQKRRTKSMKEVADFQHKNLIENVHNCKSCFNAMTCQTAKQNVGGQGLKVQLPKVSSLPQPSKIFPKRPENLRLMASLKKTMCIGQEKK